MSNIYLFNYILLNINLSILYIPNISNNNENQILKC